MSRFFVITGESSGDKLAAIVASGLLSKKHELGGWGGSSMRGAGVTIFQDISALKIMGWTDVFRSLPKVLTLLSKCKEDIKKFQPDALILVDFGSFNLRIAKWAKSAGYHIIYYSPPKIWASRANRIQKLQKYTDQIIVLFPFEKEYYNSKGVKVDYFGHPFANEIKFHSADPAFRSKYNLGQKPILAILPGSRKSEIEKTLPIYLSAVEDDVDHHICISCSDGMKMVIDSVVSTINVRTTVVQNGYYDLLSNANFAFVTSGTANLDAALFKVPQIVGYKTSWLNYNIAKRIIKSSYISLVNLNLNREVLQELIQKELTADSLRKNFILLKKEKSKSLFAKEYSSLSKILTIDNCVKNTVSAITNRLK